MTHLKSGKNDNVTTGRQAAVPKKTIHMPSKHNSKLEKPNFPAAPQKGMAVSTQTGATPSQKRYIALSAKSSVAGGVKVIAKVFHIQTVNTHHSRLTAQIAKLRGVATPWHAHGCGWFRHLELPENLNKNKLFRI